MDITELIGDKVDLELNNIKENIKTRCAFCDKEIDKGITIKDTISSNFSNYEYLKKNRQYFCINCFKCFKYDKLRKNNFIVDTEKIIFFKQNEIEKYIFNLEEFKIPFGLALTRSFKKHNSFRTKLNYNYKEIYIREEDKEYLFIVDEMKQLYAILNEAYLQFTKDELLTGNYRIIGIEQYGLVNFKKLENILKKYRGSNQFNLLIYMLNSEKRNEYIKNKKKEKNNGKK